VETIRDLTKKTKKQQKVDIFKKYSNENITTKRFRWIRTPDFECTPYVCAYKKKFSIEQPDTVRIYVSADERYQLYLDGEFVGAGSERGDANNWFFESYDLNLSAGTHTIVAKVWALGEKAPSAQISLNPCCFTLSADDQKHLNILATGYSDWYCSSLEGFSLHEVPFAFAVRWREDIDGNKYNCKYRTGDGGVWKKAETVTKESLKNKPVLRQARLPKMIRRRIRSKPDIIINELNSDEFNNIENKKVLPNQGANNDSEKWYLVQDGAGVNVDANKTVRIIFSLDDYYCFYPELKLSGGKGAHISLRASEAAYFTCDHKENRHFRHPKGKRSEIVGKYFKYSMSTRYISNGNEDQLFDPLWWFSGIYVELIIKTADDPLHIDQFSLYETRYPLEMESNYDSSDKKFDRILNICFRTLQNCTHETYMDCPFYEQVMYVGDSRIEALATYTSTLDLRMPLKSIEIINESRLENGLNMSGYPYRELHVIPTFSLLWIAMVSDYCYWVEGFEQAVRPLVSDMRKIIAYFLGRRNCDGLISPGDERKYDAFNFIDWVDGWNNDWGVPRGDNEINSVFHWLFVHVLRLYSDIEKYFGNSQIAEQALNDAKKISNTVTEMFWNNNRGAYADDLDHTSFSEHSQIMAILSGLAKMENQKILSETLFNDKDLLRATIYFSHYYFEVCRMLENSKAFWDRMSMWYEIEENDFKTVCESTLPTRSDCHAWSAHPLFHYYATILGIRPMEYGFNKVEVKPLLGKLKYAKGSMVHIKGNIDIELGAGSEKLTGSIYLPEGLKGVLSLPDEQRILSPGRNNI
jgi:hypothetical protein